MKWQKNLNSCHFAPTYQIELLCRHRATSVWIFIKFCGNFGTKKSFQSARENWKLRKNKKCFFHSFKNDCEAKETFGSIFTVFCLKASRKLWNSINIMVQLKIFSAKIVIE
jgi:hypothetical protein